MCIIHVHVLYVTVHMKRHTLKVGQIVFQITLDFACVHVFAANLEHTACLVAEIVGTESNSCCSACAFLVFPTYM